MLKLFKIQTVFWAIFFASLPATYLNAHPGHAHSFGEADPVTISRNTHNYLLEVISHYLKIQQDLTADKFSDTVKNSAKEIERVATSAAKKESSRSGKKMYKGVAKSAAEIHSTADIKTARETFVKLNDIFLPFFDTWTIHLSQQNLVLYTCKDTKQWWLQSKDEEPADPYRGASAECKELSKKAE